VQQYKYVLFAHSSLRVYHAVVPLFLVEILECLVCLNLLINNKVRSYRAGKPFQLISCLTLQHEHRRLYKTIGTFFENIKKKMKRRHLRIIFLLIITLFVLSGLVKVLVQLFQTLL